VPTSRVGLDARAELFSVRIINAWNRLSDEIVNAFSILSIYNRLIFYLFICFTIQVVLEVHKENTTTIQKLTHKNTHGKN